MACKLIFMYSKIILKFPTFNNYNLHHFVKETLQCIM